MSPIIINNIQSVVSPVIKPVTVTGLNLPTATPTSTPAAAGAVDPLHWVDPVLANALALEFPNSKGVPKSALGDALIAPSPSLSADTVFQSAKDSNQYFYLPAFSIWANQQGYGVRFAAAAAAGWRLDVTVVEAMPAGISLPPPPAKLAPYEAATRFYLSYETPERVVTRYFENASKVTAAGISGYQLSTTVDTVGLRDDIFAAMTKSESMCRLNVVRTLAVAIPGSDSEYRIEAVSVLDAPPHPFVFPYETHKTDIYSFVVGGVDGNTPPRPVQVVYQGTTYDYFQDPVEPTRFYYLPDAFKLARRPSAPHYPCLSIALEGDTLERAQATVSYVAMPVVDPERLRHAMTDPQVIALAGGSARPFEPFPARTPVFSLRLPDDGTTGPYSVRSQAHVNVATGIRDEVTKLLSDLQQIFAALFDQTSFLFTGYVTVTLTSTVSHEIPFFARIHDTVGDVFDQTATLSDANTINVTLRSAIEGAIRLLAPPTASVLINGERVSCAVQDAPRGYPVELKPPADGKGGDELHLTITCPVRLADGQYQLAVETNHEVESIGADVLGAVLDPRAAAHFSQELLVKIPAGVFAARASAVGPQLVAVEVIFETGATASFAAPAPSSANLLLVQTVTIHRSLVDYLLGSADDGAYKYRVGWVYSDGHRQQEPDWRSDNRTTLIPDLLVPAYPAQAKEQP